MVPHEHMTDVAIELPPRQKRAYQRPPKDEQRMVPTRYIVG
jgi:hypothetical protein